MLPRVAARRLASSWAGLGVAPALCGSLQAAGYAAPNSLQAQYLPQLLAGSGRPMLLGAETGTGKTLCAWVCV